MLFRSELLAATGCRVSELVALDRAKLELDRRAQAPGDGVRIADEVTVFGKGSRYRRVFLNLPSRRWLERYLRSRRDQDPALFVTRRKKNDGSYRMSVKMAQTIVAEAAKRAGLTENVSPHWLRHAAVTTWAKEVSVPFAQRLAGHRNVATTSRYLGSTDADRAKLDRIYQHLEAYEPLTWTKRLQQWLARAFRTQFPEADLGGPDVETGQPFKG